MRDGLYPGCRLTSFALPWAMSFWAFSPNHPDGSCTLYSLVNELTSKQVNKRAIRTVLSPFPSLLLHHLRGLNLAHLPNLVADGEKGDADDDEYCQHEVEDKGWQIVEDSYVGV